jgi:hypothetical protein
MISVHIHICIEIALIKIDTLVDLEYIIDSYKKIILIVVYCLGSLIPIKTKGYLSKMVSVCIHMYIEIALIDIEIDYRSLEIHH